MTSQTLQTPTQNQVTKMVAAIDRFPGFMKTWALSKAFGTVIPYAGRAKIRVETLNHHECVVTLANRRKVQNHIGTLHAAAMALVAESATGFLVGMNVPKDKVPVIKELGVAFHKRTSGGIQAKAHLTDDQIQQMQTQEKGEVIVPVTVTDAEGKEPVECRMVWAWTPKRR